MSAPKTKRQKREEAEARNAAWASLPLEAKLARLHARPGNSQRQRARLMTPAKQRVLRKIAERAS